METEIVCKRCGSSLYIKNGTRRNKQCYKCKDCNYNFVFGDQRLKLSEKDKALCALLYGRGKASYRFLAKLFGVSQVSIMNFLKKYSDSLPAPVLDASIAKVSFDEMWHFVNNKKRSYGFGEQWSAFEIELSGGLLGLVLLQHSESSLEDLSI